MQVCVRELSSDMVVNDYTTTNNNTFDAMYYVQKSKEPDCSGYRLEVHSLYNVRHYTVLDGKIRLFKFVRT